MILGPDGKPATWMPSGYKEKSKAPTIALSDKFRDQASSEEEVAKWKEEQRNIHRCPICSCPYESAEKMAECAAQPVDKEVSNFLGFDTGQIVRFRLHNPKSGWTAEANGAFIDWRIVRTPKGHEEMPMVEFQVEGVDGDFHAILVPDERGRMTAYPHFTRSPNDPHGEL